jgi:hypothetical protein
MLAITGAKRGGELIAEGAEKAFAAIGRRALKSIQNAREQRLQNPERQITKKNKASIMAPATPFCFWTTQKYLTIERTMSSWT